MNGLIPGEAVWDKEALWDYGSRLQRTTHLFLGIIKKLKKPLVWNFSDVNTRFSVGNSYSLSITPLRI